MILLLCFGLWLGEPAVYGQAVDENAPLVNIEKLMENPDAYLNKVIRVTGQVTEVCPMAGCWMDVSTGKDAVRIKVKDGEIVFDQELKGKQVMAYGTVYKFDLTAEKAVEYYRHLAEEKGEKFDPSSVTGPATIYQIGGIGAHVVDRESDE